MDGTPVANVAQQLGHPSPVVLDEPSRPNAKPLVASEKPEECVRVEEQPQERYSSKSASGASKLSGISNTPRALPKTRVR